MKLIHRYADTASTPDDVIYGRIPGLVWNSNQNIATGDVSALEIAGANPRKEWPQLFSKVELPTTEHLRKYQLDAASWCVQTMRQFGGAILADDMGLGKTRTALYAAGCLPDVKCIVIVCPANVAYQWQREAELLGQTAIVLGPKSKKVNIPAWEKAKSGLIATYIVSYNMSNEALDTLPHSPTCIVLDEPHMVLRGRTGKWAWALKEHMTIIKHRLATTGTPMFNTPRDMWFILFLLFNMRFGKAKEFDVRYCDGKEGQYGWTNKGAMNLAELKQRLTYYMLRRTMEDVALELPALTTSFRWVDCTSKAQAAMMKAGRGAFATDEALHSCLDAKLPTVVETACELIANGPCVIFTYHRHHADKIAEMIESEGHKCVAIHGGLSTAVRDALIQQCAATGTSIAATIDSCGTGVNMQGVASQGIFHTIERSPKKTHQAMKRLHRSGQTRPVHWVFTAMKDAMDEIVVEEVVKRLDYWNQLMGKDDMEDNVGTALATDAATEDAVLAAIYNSMKEG